MLARNPKLFHLVLIAACSVAVAVILTIWHINGIAGPPGRDILIGMYRKLKNIILLATIDVNFSNKTKNKSQEISFHDHSYDMEKKILFQMKQTMEVLSVIHILNISKT